MKWWVARVGASCLLEAAAEPGSLRRLRPVPARTLCPVGARAEAQTPELPSHPLRNF